ncbi:MAG: hypothetical protein U0K60_11195 [Parafannyhessea umbonata]|nr:hypothetical protein [Parafannyhessea umbonata]
MINMVTGTEMSVPADLVEKYLAAGHRLAESPAAEPAAPAKKPARKKTATK